MLHNPEYRLKSRSGQDRSVNQRNARTTDKGFPCGRIYSLVPCNNKKETWVETKAPHILTYGLEGLEGLRVGNSDALEVRVGAYYNYTCNAPGWNLRVALSA